MPYVCYPFIQIFTICDSFRDLLGILLKKLLDSSAFYINMFINISIFCPRIFSPSNPDGNRHYNQSLVEFHIKTFPPQATKTWPEVWPSHFVARPPPRRRRIIFEGTQSTKSAKIWLGTPCALPHLQLRDAPLVRLLPTDHGLCTEPWRRPGCLYKR